MNLAELGDQLGLDEDEYRELVELFVDSGGADLKALRDALAENNADQVMRCAHTIKGASGNLGMLEISEKAGIIEENAAKHQLQGLSSVVETLQAQIDALAKQIGR